MESDIVSRLCPAKPSCPELFKKFGVDGVARLELTTAVSRNFGLGYADSITGTLAFEDKSGRTVQSISNSTQRTGGLLLNSGQLVEAIKSQAKSFNDSTFEPLAREFARGIVAKLAPPAGLERRFSGKPLVLGEPAVEQTRRGNNVLCILGTPQSFVVITRGQTSAPLRETKPGRYCAALRSVGPVAVKPYRVELRTPSGLETEKQFNGMSGLAGCDLASVLALDAATNSLRLQCNGDGCPERLVACEKAKKIVYRAESPAGPFTRLGEFIGKFFKVKKPPNDATIYSVLVPANEFSASTQPVIIQASGK